MSSLSPRSMALGLGVGLLTGCPTDQPMLPPLSTEGDPTSGPGMTTSVSTATETTSLDSSSGTTRGGTATDGSTTTDADSSSGSGEVLACGLIDGACTPAGGGWWDTRWSYRRQVDIASPTGSSLTDAMVPIRLGEDFDPACAREDGGDLRVVDGAGTERPHEIDEWGEYGHVLWVHLDTLEPAGETLWLYYGNEAATRPTDEVWPSDTGPLGLHAVLHFAGDLQDARGDHDGEPAVAGALPQYAPDGVFGRAIHFERILLDTRVELTDSVAIDEAMAMSHAMTISAWVRTTPDVAAPTPYRTIVSRGSAFWSLTAYDPSLPYDFLDPVYGRYVTALDGMGPMFDELENPTEVVNHHLIASWHHMACVLEEVGMGQYDKHLYVDGVLTSDTGAFALDWPALEIGDLPLTIGSGPENSLDFVHHGEIDQVQLASEAWTSDRIAAEFEFGDDPSLVTVAAPECQ